VVAGGVYAVADIHSPRYLPLLREALGRLRETPCLLLLAGDLIDKGRAEMLEPVVRLLEDRLGGVPAAAVFGNEEYEEARARLRELAGPRVRWLDDEVGVWSCDGLRIAVVGTTGALDRPTRWQRRHRPELARVYRERPRLVERLIREARGVGDRVILLSHYGLARATLRGEDPRIWPELYSSSMEEVIVRSRPDAAVHGHAHNGTPRASVGGVPVYNVALPLNRRLVKITFRVGLDAFL
jgi:Icc-related predicted phosphoesterase